MKTAQSCPNESVLRRLATGSLTEQHAEDLFIHLDECAVCQATFDQMGLSMAGILGAVERGCQIEPASKSVQEPPGEDKEQLSRLIRQAQKLAQLESAEQDRKTPQHDVRLVSFDQFVQCLRSSGLFPAEEVEQCLSEFESKSGSSSSELFAQDLVSRRVLTVFQAKLLLKGRWKGLVLGDYAILERLGQGGMGSVFMARHQTLNRTVCLKVISSAGRQSPTALDRFRIETRALATLNHPNIVVAHDAGESKGVPYLVMEYIEGADLAKHVKSTGPMPVEAAIGIAIQVARAMEYAHRQGVIHRDIKPHNLFLSLNRESGRHHVHVLDLGLAKFDSLLTNNLDASVMAAMTNTGIVVGTVDYMSPEQALDSRTADARSDIYSLGCTLFYLITGRPPFEGETVMQRLIAHREHQAPLLESEVDGLPNGLQACIERMLAKDPVARQSSMQEVIDDLQRVQNGTYSRPTQSAVGRPPPSAKNPNALAVIPPPIRTAGPLPLAPESSGESLSFDASAPSPHDATVSTALAVEPDVDNPTSNRPNRRNRRVAIGIASLAAIAVCAFGISILIPAVVPREGRDRAIKNGGLGRALVVVSSKRFEDREYRALVDELQLRDIDVVTASPNFGTTDKDYGKELKQATDNIPLDQFAAADFDAVYFIGGDNWDLIHKTPKNHELVKRIVNEAVANNVVVSSIGKGWDVVADSHGCEHYDMRHDGQIRVAKIKDKPGKYFHSKEVKGVSRLLDAVFSDARELKKSNEQ